MLDAVYQSVVIYFLIRYTYFSPAAHPDGYDVAQYEFTTVMIISAVMCVNIFNGLNAAAWTGWVFFAVFIGIILIWAYTVRAKSVLLGTKFTHSSHRLSIPLSLRDNSMSLSSTSFTSQ